MRAYQKRLLLGAGLALFAAQPASAAIDDPWYFTLRAGPSFAQDSKLVGPQSGLRAQDDHKVGIGFGAGVGYDFGGVRLEAEISRHENKVKKFVFDNAGGFPFGAGTFTAAHGKTNATNFMANMYYDIDLGGPLKPYLGFGLGASRLNYDNYRVGATTFLDKSKTVFAYQGIAGLRYTLTKTVDLTLDYRYFGTENPKLVDTLGRDLNGKYRTHLGMVGLVWKFGGPAERPAPVPVAQPAPAPAPAPAPEPVPAPVPAPVKQLPGPFLINFDWDSTAISADAGKVLDEVAVAAQENKPVNIIVRGYTDTTGSAQYNDRLSEKRAAKVFDELTKRGVPDVEIGIESFGKTHLAVPTGDNVRERANRRVTITFYRK